MHSVDRARSRALFKAGSSIAARMAMIAMTMSNSIKVNCRHAVLAAREREMVFSELIDGSFPV